METCERCGEEFETVVINDNPAVMREPSGRVTYMNGTSPPSVAHQCADGTYEHATS